MTRSEMETTICFNRHEHWAIITTTDPSVARRLQKRLNQKPTNLSPNVWRFLTSDREVRLPSLPRKASKRSSDNWSKNLKKRATPVPSEDPKT